MLDYNIRMSVWEEDPDYWAKDYKKCSKCGETFKGWKEESLCSKCAILQETQLQKLK